MQSRLQSMMETLADLLAGYLINLAAVQLAAPLLGIHIGVAQNAALGLFLMAVALVRKYVLRRLFNRIHHGACHAVS